MAQPINPVGCNDCNNMSSRRFKPPSRSIFIFFQGEYKGPKRRFSIRGAPKSFQTLFHIHALTCSSYYYSDMINYVRKQQKSTNNRACTNKN